MVRNAAFFTPFRGWRHLDGVPYSEWPPRISGVSSTGGATLVMENLVCKGFWRCVDTTSEFSDHLTLAGSLFVDNYHGMNVHWRSTGTTHGLWLTKSVFFSNVLGAEVECWRSGCQVDQCLFLQNDIGIAGFLGRVHYNDMIFYKNDVAFSRFWDRNTLGNATFLENRIGIKIDRESYGALNRINFLGVGNEYHIHYTGTPLLDFSVSLTFWNTTSVNEIEKNIYDARDGSGEGLVRILAAESMPQTPFRHGLYQADSGAGQCEQSWFNTKLPVPALIKLDQFGFFDPGRSLNSGQVLRDALLKGYEPPSGMSLTSCMQDFSDLFDAVSQFQTVGTSTSPLPSTTASLAVSTTASTTRLEMRSESLETNRNANFEFSHWYSSVNVRNCRICMHVFAHHQVKMLISLHESSDQMFVCCHRTTQWNRSPKRCKKQPAPKDIELDDQRQGPDVIVISRRSTNCSTITFASNFRNTSRESSQTSPPNSPTSTQSSSCQNGGQVSLEVFLTCKQICSCSSWIEHEFITSCLSHAIIFPQNRAPTAHFWLPFGATLFGPRTLLAKMLPPLLQLRTRTEWIALWAGGALSLLRLPIPLCVA